MIRESEVLGIFTYEASDIKPGAIVIEIINSPAPMMESTTIYICNNLLDVAKTCRKVVQTWIEADVIDLNSWLSVFVQDGQNDEDMDKAMQKQLRILVKNGREISRDVKLGRRDLLDSCREVVESFSCFDNLDDIKIMKEWIEQDNVQKWLFRFLSDESYEDEKDGFLQLPEKLSIKDHKHIIAEAINRINMQPWR